VDTLIGFSGFDTFFVNHVGDTVSEGPNGNGTILASVNFTAPANISTLSLTGAATEGIGNNDGDTIVANSAVAANTLTGGTGDDTLVSGETSVDTLNGGGGIDTFVVNQSNDQVNQGTASGDHGTVLTDANFNLAISSTGHVETLILTGNATQGTGNSLGDTIVANNAAGPNTLTGGSGDDKLFSSQGFNDTLNGGGGTDTFVVDRSGDQVNEGAGASDHGSVLAYENFDLATHATGNVQVLLLLGSATQGTGNNLNDTIIANDAAGPNTLTGGSGNDTLIASHNFGDTLNGGGG